MALRRIGLDELDHFQLDDEDQLYWKGERLELKRSISLRLPELIAAYMGATGAFGLFIAEVGKLCGWWAL